MEEAAGLSILESSLLHDVVEELTTGRVLHDQEQLLTSLNDLVQLHDVRVSHDFQNVNLSHNSSDI